MGNKLEVYPLRKDSKPGKRRTTIEFPEEMASDIELVAELWDALDKELGQDEGEKWVPARVILRFCAIGLDLFWEQVGGKPTTKEERADFIQRAVEHLQTRPKK